MELIDLIIILLFIYVILIVAFAYIYNEADSGNITFGEGFFLSCQIATLVGLSEGGKYQNVKPWITVQSIVSFLLNVILVAVIGIYISTILKASLNKKRKSEK